MNRYIKKIISLTAVAAIFLSAFTGCTADGEGYPIQPEEGKIYYENETHIVLSDDKITSEGKTVGTNGDIYISDDVIYYEDKDSYESGNPYGEGTDKDKHTAEEAAATTVVNITKAGTYRISGKLSHGQIKVDLGDDAAKDENAVVTLVLDGMDINCDVAPAIIFMNVYECDNEWDAETATSDVDTSKAGANVIVADDSINNVEGAYVAKIYKDKKGEKKLWKQDAAFYSYMSMNINGETEGSGVLNITADNEGIGTELHLTINGGNINIYSDNDGINTNEDNVSVTTINSGNVHIIAGLGEEGDGVDSNGWLVINGGTVISAANPKSDAGLDSDMGSYINGGTVVALGSTMNWAESNSQQVTMNLQFGEYKDSGSAIIVAKEDGNIVFAYDPSEDEVVGSNTRQFMGAVVSCANFELGESYNVYTGGTVTGSETAGVYDTATVTAVENAIQQGHTGGDIMMHPGGFGGKDGFDGVVHDKPQGEIPQKPEGDEFEPDRMKPNFEERHQGEVLSEENRQQMQIPDKGTPPWDEDGVGTHDILKPIPTFYMQDKVNNFSGVTSFAE